MPAFRICRALLTLLLAAELCVTPVAAEQVVVSRSNTPPGTPGLDANASALANDPSNSAGAFAGDGGNPTAASPAGQSGGDATAEARTDTTGNTTATAEARGGRASRPLAAGVGGEGGSATATAEGLSATGGSRVLSTATGGEGGGPFGSSTVLVTGGNGGNASATGSGEAHAGTLDVDVTATAGAGAAGNPPARGGDATADGSGTHFGSGTADITVGANGGRGGTLVGPGSGQSGDGGNGEALAIGEVEGSASLKVHAGASGGAGGSAPFVVQESDGGTGGKATARAEGRGHGSGSITVTAVAAPGAGGGASEVAGGADRVGGIGGTGQVSAYGESTGGGDVTVETRILGARGGEGASGADGGTGADVSLVNTSTGSTSGSLTLIQRAEAGHGGELRFSPGAEPARIGDGGDAHVEAFAENPGGGSLSLQLESRAGSGGLYSSGTDPAAGGGRGGSATLRAHGSSSTGADVEVIGNAFGGWGRGQAADGASVHLDNVVTGSTTGALTLEQNATGGNGGSGSTGTGGAAGGASSRLTHTGSHTSLALTANATAGSAGLSQPGADGDAFVDAHNTGGRVEAHADADGGMGGAAPSSSAGNASYGGRATARASATSEHAGDDVIVSGNAHGGSGGHASNFVGPTSHAGDGGDAESHSTGLALGDSAVTVEDFARGGVGGFATVSGEGTGGDAISHASAENHGASAVSARAWAAGGDAYHSTPYPDLGIGGLATATASAISHGGGDAQALVTVDPGWTHGPFDGHDTIARDLVSGATSGQLRLYQEAFGGNTSSGTGGDLVQSLTAENTLGGDLRAELIGSAGGGGEGVQGGDVWIERLDLRSSTGADLDAVVNLAGGGGWLRGGDARIDPGTISLETTGDASLWLRAGGGSGATAGAGRANLVQESRAASYTLDLWAQGGTGSGASPGGLGELQVDLVSHEGPVLMTAVAAGGEPTQPSGTAAGGSGGDATLDVTVTTHGDGHDIEMGEVTEFDGEVEYEAGTTARGAWGAFTRGAAPGGSGGDATSRSRGIATGDSAVRVINVASGGYGRGEGFSGPTPSGSGGDGGSAVASAYGENHGASSVLVIASAGAGGGGSAADTGSTSARGGNAGTATLGEVFGRSTGGGDVHVIGSAQGADGGRGRTGPNGTSTEVHLVDAVDGETSGNLVLEQHAYSAWGEVDATDASSVLWREKTAQSLTVVTSASAGNETLVVDRADATARSGAFNPTGRADARATTFAGSLWYAPGGHASAVAAGDGIEGSLHASAESSVPLIERMVVEASAGLAGSASVAADVRPADVRAQTSGSHDLALSAHALLGANTDTWRSQRPGLAAELVALGLDTLVADARYDVAPGEGAGNQLDSALELTFPDWDALAVEDMHLFLVDGETSGDEAAFEEFVLRVLSGTTLMLEEHVDDLGELEALFDGGSFALGSSFDEADDDDGSWVRPLGPLRAELRWTSRDAGWRFGGSLVVAGTMVPEPGTALLLALGLALIASRRRRP